MEFVEGWDLREGGEGNERAFIKKRKTKKREKNLSGGEILKRLEGEVEIK